MNRGQTIAEVSLVPAWQQNDATIAAEAVAFWKHLGALPPDVSPEDRAKELGAAAYREGELVGVSTIVLDTFPLLRCRFGFFRCMVAPEHRRSGLGRRLVVYSHGLLASWSRDNPHEKVMGMAAIIENPNIDLNRIPVWPETKLTLIGYTREGRQIRATWFEHARLD